MTIIWTYRVAEKTYAVKKSRSDKNYHQTVVEEEKHGEAEKNSNKCFRAKALNTIKFRRWEITVIRSVLGRSIRQ